MSSALPLIAGVPLPGPANTHGLRSAALAALEKAGWPSRKREAWRYTDLEPLARASLELSPPAATDDALGAAANALARLDPDLREQALVLVDGRRIATLGARSIAKIAVSDPTTRWAGGASSYSIELPAQRFPLAALNTAFTEDGLWLRVPAGTRVEQPIHLAVVSSSRANLASQPRVVVDVEEDASVTLVQHFIDADPDVGGWVNCVTELRQAARSTVTLYRYQRHGMQRTHTSLLAATLGTETTLDAFFLDLGGRLVRNDVEVLLTERGARANVNGVFVAGAGQHIDNHTVIDHAAGATRSSEHFRGIIGARGRGVFNGKVVVRAASQHIEANQRSDNLLLADNSEIDTKPELEIYANDVKCSHGSTVGELDSEHLFYLRSRGLDEAEARDLLTMAFAASALALIDSEPERGRALALVTERLRHLERQ